MKTNRNNNAYQVEVVKKLLNLSDTLIEEVNGISGKNYGFRIAEDLFEIGKKIKKNYHAAKKENNIRLLKKENNGPSFLLDQYFLADEIRSDPFIPKNIRIEVAKFYVDRCCTILDIYKIHIGKFCDEYFKLGDKYCEKKGLDYSLQTAFYLFVASEIGKSNFSDEKSKERIEKIRGM